ncbi:hypothetical protein D3C87_1433710 [compost metagenome]
MVGCDPLQAHHVYVAGLELSVHHIQVGYVFVDQTLYMRAITKIIGIGVEQNVVTRNPLLPFECARSDRRVVIGGGIAVSFRT